MAFFELLLSWLDERKLAVLLILAGDLILLSLLILEGNRVNKDLVEIISAGIGGLSTALGIMIQGIWRDRLPRPTPPPFRPRPSAVGIMNVYRSGKGPPEGQTEGGEGEDGDEDGKLDE